MPLTDYWKDYWKSHGNPFNTEPIQYTNGEMKDILIQTSAIRKADRTIEDIRSEKAAHYFYVIGGRGMGKSTVMNYITRSLLLNFKESAYLPAYVNTIRGSERLEVEFAKAASRAIFDMIHNELPNFGLKGIPFQNLISKERVRTSPILQKRI